MPYKAKLKNPSTNPKKEAKYKVVEWAEYNKNVKKRGELILYFPRGDFKNQFINEFPYAEGTFGQQEIYKRPYIGLIYMFYRLLSLGIRQITGYFEDLWRTKKLDMPVPNFGHLSALFSTISLKVCQFCDKLAKKITHGESITLIFDSTALRFSKVSQGMKQSMENLVIKRLNANCIYKWIPQ